MRSELSAGEPSAPCVFPLLIMTAVLLAAGPPSDLEALGKFDLRAIPEASGIVKSRRYPGSSGCTTIRATLPPCSRSAATERSSVSSALAVAEYRLGGHRGRRRRATLSGRYRQQRRPAGDPGDLPDRRAQPRKGRRRDPLPSSPPPSTRCRDRTDSTPRGFITMPRPASAIIVSKRFDGREAELFAVPFSPPAPLLRPATPQSESASCRDSWNPPPVPACRRTAGCWRSARAGDQDLPARQGTARGTSPPKLRHDAPEVEGITWDGSDLILVSEGRGVDRVAEAAWRRAEAAGRPVRCIP